MPSPEQRTRGLACISLWSRRVALVGACMLALSLGGSRSSHAQPPPPASEREAERQRLLDQLGLKKRAPVAPSGGASGDADREKKTEKETEKAPIDGDQPPRASERPSAERGTTETQPQGPAGLVFAGAVQRALLGACKSCHNPGGVAARSAFVLGGELEADFTAAQRQVNAGHPDQSPLLRKASGAGHGGGAVLAPGGSDYQLLSRWISDGAKRGGGPPGAPGAQAAPSAVIPALVPPAADARTAPAAPAASPPPAAPVPASASVAAVAGPEGASVARLDFAPIVQDALNQACSGCHRSGALAGNTGFILSGDVATDFASTRRFVNLVAPEASPLLRKASGAGHAGGAIYPLGGDAQLRLLEWIQFGARGPTEAAASAAPEASPASAPPGTPVAPAPAMPESTTDESTAAVGNGVSLPWNFRLNGRFDLNYERRHFDTQPFSAGDDAIQSYHHFIFLSRQAQGDPVGFSAELINLTFWEVTYHLGLPESAGQLWLKAGKLLVPFGPDPLFHQSYGGLAGFDQRVLPVIWAQEGVSSRFLLERGDVSGSAHLYAVRGHALKQRDAVLNLQTDLSPVDDARVAIGARLRASWQAVSLFYSGYVNDALSSVTFPSGFELTGLGGEARCMTCHQGRSSGLAVQQAIDAAAVSSDDEVNGALGFLNIHYYPAASTLLAGRANGGYQYADRVYDTRFRHVEAFDSCTECHDPHSTRPRFEQCVTCHSGAGDLNGAHDIRMPSSSGRDYDGDGDVSEGIYHELTGVRDKLLLAMQRYGAERGTPLCYSAASYPYWFIDTDADGQCESAEAVSGNAYATWTARLVKATYNYQLATKDPGAFAHNAKYILELLHDSIEDLNLGLVVKVDLSTTVRGDRGHFDGSSEAARHWDADEAVDATCSRCHGGQQGFRFFVEYGTSIEVPETANGLECGTCHTSYGDEFAVLEVQSTTFPSGVEVQQPGFDNLCGVCHSGRASKATLDAQIATGQFRFVNVHYLPAAGTKLGSAAAIGYEYEGRAYAGPLTHMGGAQCTSCHDPIASQHSFTIADTWDTRCNVCHADANRDPEKVRLRAPRRLRRRRQRERIAAGRDRWHGGESARGHAERVGAVRALL